jgi:hypothetical protein
MTVRELILVLETLKAGDGEVQVDDQDHDLVVTRVDGSTVAVPLGRKVVPTA